MSDHSDSHWAGRNAVKATVRNRVWGSIVERGVSVGPAFDRIPHVVGADAAAKRLSELDEWKRARVVKCNPDPDKVRADQFADIPFLSALRRSIESRKRGS
jgi:5-formyltetrahydrofolate cyclo-ligase